MLELRTAEPTDGSAPRLRAMFVCPPEMGAGVFPYGFSQIVSVARKNGAAVGLVDLAGHPNTEELQERTVALALSFVPDILCLTGFTHNLAFIRAVAEGVKAAKPDTIIVSGGYWAWWCPEFAVTKTPCDFVVNGEGEITFAKFLQAWPNLDEIRKLRGITFQREDGTAQNNGSAEQVRHIDELAFAEYELFDFGNRYVTRKKGQVTASMQTGRGCIAKCTFCTAPGQTYRKFSIDRILGEIRFLKENYGVNHIRFKETLTLVKNQRSRDFLAALRDSGLNIEFHAVARLDALDEDMVRLMKEAGCESVAVGIESFDEHMLNSIMKKRLTTKQIVDALKLCQKAGIHVNSGLIVGMPGETIKSILTTAMFCVVTPLDLAAVYFPVPYPGTELYTHTVNVLGLKEDDILSDERINTGRDLMNVSYAEAIAYLRRYRYTNISPHLIIFLIRMINRICVTSSYLAKNDMRQYLWRCVRLLSADFAYEFLRVVFGALTYRFVKVPTGPVAMGNHWDT